MGFKAVNSFSVFPKSSLLLLDRTKEMREGDCCSDWAADVCIALGGIFAYCGHSNNVPQPVGLKQQRFILPQT